MRACVRVCARVCVRACVRVCVSVCLSVCLSVCNKQFPLSQTSHLQLNLNFIALSGTFLCTRYLNVSNPNKLHFVLHSKMSEGEPNENLEISNKIDTFVTAAASTEIHQHPSDARTACHSPNTVPTVCTKLAGQDFKVFIGLTCWGLQHVPCRNVHTVLWTPNKSGRSLRRFSWNYQMPIALRADF